MATTPNRPQPDSPIADVIAQYNQNFDAVDDQDRTKIIRNGATPTLLLGYQKDGFGTGVDYGLKVAKPGKDVTTATAADLAYSSAFNNLKVVTTSTSSMVVPSTSNSTTTVVIPHGLSFIPIALVYANYPTAPANTYSPAPVNVTFWNSTAGNYGVYAQLYVTVDATNVTIVVNSSGSFTAGTWNFRYYLLQESAN